MTIEDTLIYPMLILCPNGESLRTEYATRELIEWDLKLETHPLRKAELQGLLAVCGDSLSGGTTLADLLGPERMASTFEVKYPLESLSGSEDAV